MTSFPPHSGGVDGGTSQCSALACTWQLLFGIKKANHNHHLLVLPVTTKSIDPPIPPSAVASIPDDKPSAFPDVPHQSQNHNQNPTRDVDDSLSSDDDDGSTSDPFRQDSFLNENDGEEEEEGTDHSEKGGDGIWRWSSFPRPAPDNHASSNTSAGKENKGYLESLASSTTAPKTSFPAPSTGTRTASSSSTDISQQSARPGPLHDSAIGRHPSNTDTNSRALASRSANREKKPPPPPKNRHGKLINPPQPPPPSVSSNRFSYHGTPSEISISHTPSTPSYSNKPSPQAGTDYFSPKSSENENIKTPDTLRRSQSQYKRPPTPPLSRRHSQMTRSKSTLSKTNPNRLSMPVGKEGVNASPPPSPGTNSLTPSLRKPSRNSLFPTDESLLKHTPSREDHLQAETSTLSNPQRTPSVRRTGQGTSSSAVPPPPPPRRARFSNDGTRPTSVMLEKTREEDAFPHPSNANHILDDLSRLQKEVDDLRGRYESRKGSH